MKSKIGIFFIVLILGITLMPGNVRAQGFSATLDKLKAIDERLNELEAKNRELQILRKQIANIPISELAGIGAAINTLRVELEELKHSIPQSASDGTAHTDQIETLAADLRGLVGELRNTFAGQGGIESEVLVGEDFPLEISGFGDVYSESRQDGESGDNFALGQVEVDFETNIDEKIVIGAAIAFDVESETFGLGAFTVDFHLWDSDGGHFQPVQGIDHSGVIAGQFDVPFGIDWYVYPSIDRKLVTVPLVVENTHDGWNDYGLIGYMDNRYFNTVLYGANGFGYESGVDLNGDPIEINMNFSTGARVGMTPHEYFEIGGSYAGFFNEENKIDMSLLGADLQFNYQGFSAKGEYIAHGIGLEGDSSVTNTGFYGQGMYDFGKYYAVARYGVFSPDEDGVDDINRTSIGVGWVPTDAFQLRYEYQANSEDADDVSYFQLAVGF